MAEETSYACPCCGYKTLEEEPPGTWLICPVCFWEDDPVQFDDPDYAGGANKTSLRQAQKNFVDFGACDRSAQAHVRPPNEHDKRDDGWRPL